MCCVLLRHYHYNKVHFWPVAKIFLPSALTDKIIFTVLKVNLTLKLSLNFNHWYLFFKCFKGHRWHFSVVSSQLRISYRNQRKCVEFSFQVLMRFNARNSINFAAQLLRVKKGKVEEFLSNSIKLLYIWDFFLELPLTQFLIFLELLAYFKRQETLFASQFSKKVQWQLIFDALLLLNQKLLRKSLRLGFFFLH